jgi:hypothetical protein
MQVLNQYRCTYCAIIYFLYKKVVLFMESMHILYSAFVKICVIVKNIGVYVCVCSAHACFVLVLVIDYINTWMQVVMMQEMPCLGSELCVSF